MNRKIVSTVLAVLASAGISLMAGCGEKVAPRCVLTAQYVRTSDTTGARVYRATVRPPRSWTGISGYAVWTGNRRPVWADRSGRTRIVAVPKSGGVIRGLYYRKADDSVGSCFLRR